MPLPAALRDFRFPPSVLGVLERLRDAATAPSWWGAVRDLLLQRPAPSPTSISPPRPRRSR
jgi:hypothetical protein